MDVLDVKPSMETGASALRRPAGEDAGRPTAHGQSRPEQAVLVRLAARSGLPKKASSADLRSHYRLTFLASLALALLVVIALFHWQIRTEPVFEAVVSSQEVVQIEEIRQTKQQIKPPPPPRPPVPVEVPNSQVLEEVELNLDATLDIGEPLAELPPPPPPAPEEKEEVREPEPEIFVVVEQMPELIGGIASIQKLLRYPEMARRADIEGRVFVEFVVDENGIPQNPRVLRGIGGGCDEEAVRVVKEARFTPGRQRGKAVRVRYVLPVVFKLR